MSQLVMITLMVAGQYYYDDHTIAVGGRESTFILEDNSGILPRPQENYEVQNIGRTAVRAQLWYGDALFAWWGIVDEAEVQPGNRVGLDNLGKSYYYTGLKILNSNDTRAIVHAEGGDLPSPFVPTINKIEQVLLDLLDFGAMKLLPYGKYWRKFVHIIDFFWPHGKESKESLWQNMTDKIVPLLNQRELKLVQSLLSNNIRVYEEQIKSLQVEMDDGERPREHYISIAYSLVGVENQFIFHETMDNYNEINVCLLPLYSQFISMKMNFYVVGIINKEEIGLTSNDIIDIKRYMSSTVEAANRYIMGMQTEPVDAAYNTSLAAGIFNSMMTIRTHLALHGAEYLPFWKKMAADPLHNVTVRNDVLSYSKFFGRPSANLYAQATPREVPEPLQPKMVDGERDELAGLRVYLSEEGDVAGLRLAFASNATYDLGRVTGRSGQVDLRATYVSSLTAFGDGRIDGLRFRLGSGAVLTFGNVASKTSHEFALANHRIASVYVANDSRYLGNHLANIAVSYQWV